MHIFFRYQGGKKINTTVIHLNECIGLYKRYRICNEKVTKQFLNRMLYKKLIRSFFLKEMLKCA